MLETYPGHFKGICVHMQHCLYVLIFHFNFTVIKHTITTVNVRSCPDMFIPGLRHLHFAVLLSIPSQCDTA